MSIFGAGHEVVTSTTKPSSPSLGQLIYCTDTDEYLKYVSYGGSNRWMQANLKPNRNILINGGFDVWQRGTSLSAAGGAYGADMWREYTDTGSGTQTKDTTVYAGNNRASYKWTTGGSASNWSIFQFIETSNCLHTANKKVTLSFWAATSTSRVLGAYIYYSTSVDAGFGGSFTLIDTLNFNTSTSLQLFNLTVTVPSNAKTLEVAFGAGTGGTFAAGVTINITGVQLEIGTAPSEFEFEPYETTLRKCQRYYYEVIGQRYVLNPGAYTYWLTPTVHPVEMRANPTVVARRSKTGTINEYDADGGGVVATIAYGSHTTQQAFFYATSTTRHGLVWWSASAEL
jgi:hypothetical protein